MKLKRIITIVLGSILLFTLVSCACSCKKDNNETPVEPEEPTVEPIIINNDYYSEDNFIPSAKKISETTLVTYDGPEYLSPSKTVKVSVEGVELFVYETRVNHDRKFSWMTPSDTNAVVIFDFEGKVHVEIEVDEEVTTASVKPLMYGISASVAGRKISFDLTYAANYVVEYNNNPDKAIHLFTSEPEEDPITYEESLDDENVIYIGPGVYKADAIPVKDNVTIYLAGGAYVYGQIRAESLKNITIRGRGIISGSIYNRRSESEYTIPVEMRYCDNVKIEGITFLDPAGWTIALYKSKNIDINNIKIISARQNGDGISVQSSTNVNVYGGFIRTWDDSLVVKCVDGGDTEHVLFDGVTVWTDLAQSMEVGYEAHGDKMDDVTFNNIVVIHNFHKAVISMHDADDAQISNVKYTNITVEDCQTLGDNRTDGENDFLIDLCVLYNQDWSRSTNIKGTVKNVLIENVWVYSILPSIISRINGESPTANIDGVTIKNIELAGLVVQRASDLGLVSNQYTANITVVNETVATGAKISLPYDVSELGNNVNKTHVANIAQEGMIVPDFAVSKGGLPYIGPNVTTTYNAQATHGVGTKSTSPADDGSGDFSRGGTSAANSCDGNLETSWKSKEWQGVDDEFATLQIDFGTNKMSIGVIRLYGKIDNQFYYTYSFSVWGINKKADGTMNNKFIRLLNNKDYAMTPGSNNIIDLNITPNEYSAIQFRFFKNNLDSSPMYYEVSEVEFYPPSLSYQKSIVYSTPHNDVYPVGKLVDGDATGTSYYESAELPAVVVIDLGDVYSINAIVLCLPPSLMWDARTEEIEILGSDSTVAYTDATQFTQMVAKTGYLFDPQTGNRNIIMFETPVSARFIKVVITSNDIKAGYNAQLSEISVYGE